MMTGTMQAIAAQDMLRRGACLENRGVQVMRNAG